MKLLRHSRDDVALRSHMVPRGEPGPLPAEDLCHRFLGGSIAWRNAVILVQENDRLDCRCWRSATTHLATVFLACLAAVPTMEIRDVVANAESLTGYDRFRCVCSLGLR